MSRLKRIQMLSRALIWAVSAFMGWWSYEYAHRIWDNILTAEWGMYNGVDDALIMTTAMRVWAVAYYAPVVIIAFVSYWFAVRLLYLYRQGVIFDVRAARALMGLGWAFVGIALVDTFITATERWFLTLWNADGPLAPRYYYDAGDITIGLAGLGFCLIGWITREGLFLVRENEGFI